MSPRILDARVLDWRTALLAGPRGSWPALPYSGIESASSVKAPYDRYCGLWMTFYLAVYILLLDMCEYGFSWRKNCLFKHRQINMVIFALDRVAR